VQRRPNDTAAVIASEAKQSTPPLPDHRTFDHGEAGLLRSARNDGVDGPTQTASSAKAWSPERHQRGDRP